MVCATSFAQTAGLLFSYLQPLAHSFVLHISGLEAPSLPPPIYTEPAGTGRYQPAHLFGSVIQLLAPSPSSSEYLKTGRLVLGEGEIQTSSWETDAGETRYSWTLRAYQLKFLGGRYEQEEVLDEENIPFWTLTRRLDRAKVLCYDTCA